MSNRRDYYYKQLVTEAELDAGFAQAELADQNFMIDGGLVGINHGLSVTEQGVPNLTVQVSGPGVVYDQTGQRTAITGTQTVDVSVDENSVSTAVAGGGNSRIISIFIKFKRALSDLRTDGNGSPVYFIRDESFEFKVAAGSEAPSPTAPALRSDQILLCDITRAFGQTTIVNANISTTRRQNMFKTTASTSGLTVNQGRILAALQSLVDQIGGQTGTGGGGVMGVGARTAWLGGRTNPAATIFAAIDKIITDLAATTSNDDGAERIGAQAVGNLSVGSVRSQLTELDTEKAKLAGGNTFTGGTQTIQGAFGVDLTDAGSFIQTAGDIIAGQGSAEIDPAFSVSGNISERKLLFQASLAGGGTDTFVRFYAAEAVQAISLDTARRGFEITVNAVYDGTTNLWSKDDTADSSAFVALHLGDATNAACLTIGTRDAGAGTWGNSGWTKMGLDGREFTGTLTKGMTYGNGMCRGWIKGFSGATIEIDEDYGVASVAASAGGGVTITWDITASGALDQTIFATGDTAGGTTPAFYVVDNLTTTACRIRAYDATGAQLDLSTNVAADWSVLRFCKA
jgi:hypothetical protein